MAAWFNFALYALKKIVSTVFNLDLGLGFSLGDFEIACLVIGMIATALIIKTGSFASISRSTVESDTMYVTRTTKNNGDVYLTGHERHKVT